MSWHTPTGLTLASVIDDLELTCEGLSPRPPTTTPPHSFSLDPGDPHVILAKSHSLVSNFIRPVNIQYSTPPSIGRNGAPLPVPSEVLRAAKILHNPSPLFTSPTTLSPTGSFIPTIYTNFISQTLDLWPHIETDIRQTIVRCDQALLSRTPNVTIKETLDGLWSRLASWCKGWSNGLKVLDKVSEEPYLGRFASHFNQMLRASLGTEGFVKHLKRYLRMTLPPPYIATRGRLPPKPLPWMPAASSKMEPGTLTGPKLSKDLFRLLILAGFSTVVSDIAHEQIDLLVQGQEIGYRSGTEGMSQQEDDEEDGMYGFRRLHALEMVVMERVVGWLMGFVELQPTLFAKRVNIELRMKHRLQMAMYDQLTQELFDMIVDYPQSQPGLQDLKEIALVNKYIKRSNLIQSLKDSNDRRLLVPGADTEVIIKQYVNIIRCLRIVDPAGVTLHAVSEPIRMYLKTRSDTIKCMVSMLVDSNDLVEEEEDETNIKPIQIRNDEVEEWNDPKWEPEPVDAPAEYRSRKASDIISTLVSLYDSRDVIVTELQELLAKRLLEIERYELEEEIKMVEILKLRFGEATLQVCEVMLKDLADSKRTDAHVQAEKKIALRPIILSRMYWPTMTTMKLKLPKRLRNLQSSYEQAYHVFKQDKHLRWFQNQGTVVLELELQDRSLEVVATPLQAAVIDSFARKPRRTLEKLAKKIGLDIASFDEEKLLKHAVNFWINEGVLSNVFWDPKGRECVMLNEEVAQALPGERSEILETEEGPIMESASERRLAFKQGRWPELEAFLHAQGAATTDDIVTKVFGVSKDLRLSHEEEAKHVEAFLGSLVREGLISYHAEDQGYWMLT